MRGVSYGSPYLPVYFFISGEVRAGRRLKFIAKSLNDPAPAARIIGAVRDAVESRDSTYEESVGKGFLPNYPNHPLLPDDGVYGEVTTDYAASQWVVPGGDFDRELVKACGVQVGEIPAADGAVLLSAEGPDAASAVLDAARLMDPEDRTYRTVSERQRLRNALWRRIGEREPCSI